MKSVTIHNMDLDLYRRLKESAEKQGLSMNKLVKKLLRKSLGLSPISRKEFDFSDLIGSWGPEEARQFEQDLDFFDKVSLDMSDEKD